LSAAPVNANTIEQRWVTEWWEDFTKMDREEFERTAGDLIGPKGRFSILRKLIAEAGAP
jgi:hypothetical protein